MAGSPKKREKREKAKALMADQKFWGGLFDYISHGGSLVEYAALNEVPYSTLHRNLHDDQQRKDLFDAARRARATWHVDRMEKLAEQVETGQIDPNAGRVIADIRKWVATRMDQKQWGDKVQQDIKLTDTTQLHLEAVRNLMRTVSVQDPEKLTQDTATDADFSARDS
jgi:hypothetical protein